jgi:hypothetical protein
MTLSPVQSSCVKGVGYDETGRILVVDFIKTGVYTYFDVPEGIYNEFLNAPSMGAFVNKVFKQSNWPNIKGMLPDVLNLAPLE